MSNELRGEKVFKFIGVQTGLFLRDDQIVFFEKRSVFENWVGRTANGWLTFWTRSEVNGTVKLEAYQIPVPEALHDRLSNAIGSTRYMFREDVFPHHSDSVIVRNYRVGRGDFTFATFAFESQAERERHVPPSWCGSAVSQLAIHGIGSHPSLRLLTAEDLPLDWTRVDLRDKEVGIEVERRFLVDPSLLPHLQDPKRIVQAYLVTDPKSPVRVRLTDADEDNALVTIKGERVGFGRLEYQALIPRPVGDSFVHACSNVVIKDRYSHVADGLTWEIDIFLGDNAPLVIAEAEVSGADGENFLRHLRPPKYCIQEIVSNRFNNEVLAEHPYREDEVN
ncbi:hypothetical protein CH252_06815 [Rhodococcus sp. 06-1477-1B]|nr:hypothetical protein CH252_06815 [Rhodococcus sp. 06-1477-1B]